MYLCNISHDNGKIIRIRIVENAWIAYIAMKILKAKNVAIVFGSWICLYGATKQELFESKTWLHHEVRHVRQWYYYSFLIFPFYYLLLSLSQGYSQNKLERDAKQAAYDVSVMQNIVFIEGPLKFYKIIIVILILVVLLFLFLCKN